MYDPKKVIDGISKFWEENDTFKKSVFSRSDKNEIIFFDGPPFKSGDPHYGHGLTSSMKDTIGRYYTMKGYKVPRNWGRDCHGLPVEKYVEKKLGIDGKRDIENKIGIEKFVEECRNVVYKENESREWFIKTLGRRADMDNAYYTADLDFMESTIRIFKQLYNRGLVYKSFKVQGYCPSCGTPLSNAEIVDGYKDKQDPAITVKFKIIDTAKSQLFESVSGDVYFLVWTTTPWTLPSNMFLAVGEDIDYLLIQDKNNQEHYILAEALVSKYYKNEDEYKIVKKIKGKELKGLKYKPLFNYVSNSPIDEKYKKEFFQVLLGDFVTTDSGTGIVHLAPAFGEDDRNAVTQILPKQEALQRLFLPVNEYGEFTELVPDYQGKLVFDANKDIIQRLKKEGKLIHQATINHSYPHCRRCKTPLVYKAIHSWFIKEHEIAKDSVEKAEKINRVPNYVKKRFTDILKSAPDWNISRNRYRGAPIPIWENENNPEDRIVIGNLNELFFYTKNGSKNITKFVFVRHGETTFNPEKKMDIYGNSELSEKGKQEAEKLVDSLSTHFYDLEGKKTDYVIFISPLQRTFQTIKPTLEQILGAEEIKAVEKKYHKIMKKYQEIYDKGEMLEYLKNPDTQKTFEIGENIFVDFRAVDIFIPEMQGKPASGHGFFLKHKRDEKLCNGCESLQEGYERIKNFILDIGQNFKTKTIIIATHCEPIIFATKFFRNFDYYKHRYTYRAQNSEIRIHFFDNEREKEVDLHRPYVDNYRFEIDGNKYKRIEEVFDCRFESGSMPYGQINYLGDDDYKKQIFEKKYYYRSNFPYPADFIIEGLDQTRGWFRTLHILGNGLMRNNAFKNVVVNGLILAEDGKKMSKSLKNYPDPKYLFEKYGTDAYRLYLLTSPAVRAEPLRFSEKGVEQVYKDFVLGIYNAFNFFKTYGKVDNFKNNLPEVYFVRHAEAESTDINAELTNKGKISLDSKEFLNFILQINPAVLIVSNTLRTRKTAEKAVKILKEYLNYEPEVVYSDKLFSETKVLEEYQEILEKYKGKKILIVAHNYTFSEIWTYYYGKQKRGIKNLEFVKLPTWKIKNELDKWILAELNLTVKNIDEKLQNFNLDGASKSLYGFVDKLNNWFIRRSRRRFWKNGRDEDKKSAYYTLFEILKEFLKLAAPFTPFVTEYIWQQLKEFGQLNESVHLDYFPLSSEFYIDENLLEEIKIVRKIISLGLYLRSKNNIKIKQPLKDLIVG